jgi:RNA polymerase subunit RPABC4/transcription elongation factor Spt4
VTRSDRRGSRQWRFSDSGSRFDRKRRGSIVDRNPISAAFPRKVIHCRKCGTRIVSNIKHCPFCGKSVLPFYQKLWFWLIIVFVLGASTVALLVYTQPPATPDEVGPEKLPPRVIDAPEGTPYKNLAVNRQVDCGNLLVRVTRITEYGISSDGKPIVAVTVEFDNRNDHAVTLYSTQWMMTDAEGLAYVDCFIGKTEEGESIRSGIEAVDLAGGTPLTTTFYFAGPGLTTVVFLPDALSYQESDQVTWKLVLPDAQSTEGATDAEGTTEETPEGAAGEGS